MVVVVYRVPDEVELMTPMLLLFIHNKCELSGVKSDLDLKQIFKLCCKEEACFRHCSSPRSWYHSIFKFEGEGMEIQYHCF